MYPFTRIPYFTFLIVLFLSACSSQNTKQENEELPLANNIYCDSYFIYDMCAEDIDRNGEIDFMYFQDTDEIFMKNPRFPLESLPPKPLHRCVQSMDEGMIIAGTRLLTITDDTNGIEAAQIKSRLLMQFIKAQGRMETCEPRTDELSDASNPTKSSTTASDTEFGEEDFEDF